jgi:hypothetical protein
VLKKSKICEIKKKEDKKFKMVKKRKKFEEKTGKILKKKGNNFCKK